MNVDTSTSMFPMAYSDSHGPMSGVALAGSGKYPNPFLDIASEYVPRDLVTIFELCEFLMITNGTYRSASRRVVRYFLTDLLIEGADEEECKKYEDFFYDDLKIMTQLAEIGDDFLTYGNVFISIFFPFDRYLICPKCHTNFHVDTVQYKFTLRDGQYRGECPQCGDVTFKREDRRSPELNRVKLIRWNPKNIRLRVHPISGQIEYFMEIDQVFIKWLEEGNPFFLNQTPWSIVDAVIQHKQGSGNPLFKFRKESIYHLKEPTLAGLLIKGWGIPPIMPNFKLAYYIQLLRRYDEAIALDFIVPFRILHPGGTVGPGGQDPLSTMSMQTFMSAMQNMVDRKRKNITDIQIAPMPVGYQMVGGEAKELAPKESMALAIDELLNALGYPAELYKGTLSIQAFPVALRLFEKTWGCMVDGYNDIIQWVIKRVGTHFLWNEVTGTLRSVTLADDIERKALALQAAAGQDISKQTAYRPLGIDYLEEQRRVVEEQAEIQKLQQEAMEQQQAEQAPGMQQQGTGQPSDAANMQAGATPGDVYEQGKALAQQLLFQVPDGQRRGELIKIKHSNPTLHAIVLQEMNQLRSQMASQGQAMMMQQNKQASEVPGPTAIDCLIASQTSAYTRNDLRKIARDIGLGIRGTREAFSFVRNRMYGLA